MDELFITDKWIFETLSTDATITATVGTRIFSDLAPQNIAYPLLTYSAIAINDVFGVGTTRFYINALYLIRIITTGETFTTIKNAANQIDTLFHGKQTATAYGRIVACTRERPFKLVEAPENGVRYNHRGGIYRILARSL